VVGAAFDRIALDTAPHLQRDRVRLLRVNATPSLTLRWLIPRLSSFQLENPSIEVRVTTSNEPLATCEPAFDIFLRRGPQQVAGFVTDWRLPDYRAPVCSPTRLAFGPPDQVGSLKRHTLLYSRTRPTVWSEWLNAAGGPGIKPHHSLVFEHTFQAVQGAVEGLGVAMGSWSLIMDDVAAGRLVLPFSEPKLRTDVYRAYTPIAKASDFVAARFCSWLQRVSAPIEGS
jgi:LysR family transcriptional regulator, glycine cleavage system transcriptional activator